MAGPGRRGPAAKPTELKRKAGNRGHQKLPEPIEVVPTLSKPPDPPSDLGSHGLATWGRVWTFALSWLAPSDYDLVRLIAVAMDERAALAATVVREGATFQTEKGYLGVHPALSELRKLDSQITTWLGLAGLTPSDRSRLGFAEVRRASKLADFKAKMAKG